MRKRRKWWSRTKLFFGISIGVLSAYSFNFTTFDVVTTKKDFQLSVYLKKKLLRFPQMLLGMPRFVRIWGGGFSPLANFVYYIIQLCFFMLYSSSYLYLFYSCMQRRKVSSLIENKWHFIEKCSYIWLVTVNEIN